MARHVVLLRGVNLVMRSRVSMPELRAALAAAGYKDVATYVQSGNVVLSKQRGADGIAADVTKLIRDPPASPMICTPPLRRNLSPLSAARSTHGTPRQLAARLCGNASRTGRPGSSTSRNWTTVTTLLAMAHSPTSR
jgi:uncharacterized protein (DUF1697 family)